MGRRAVREACWERRKKSDSEINRRQEGKVEGKTCAGERFKEGNRQVPLPSRWIYRRGTGCDYAILASLWRLGDCRLVLGRPNCRLEKCILAGFREASTARA